MVFSAFLIVGKDVWNPSFPAALLTDKNSCHNLGNDPYAHTHTHTHIHMGDIHMGHFISHGNYFLSANKAAGNEIQYIKFKVTGMSFSMLVQNWDLDTGDYG